MNDLSPPEAEQAAEKFRQLILDDPNLVLEDELIMSALLDADGGGGSRNVVDLRSKLVDRLEGRLARLEHTHRTVIAAAYENLAGTSQVHRAVLALLEQPNFTEFLTTLTGEVCDILGIDVMKLCLETDADHTGQFLGPEGPAQALVVGIPRGGAQAYLTDGHDRPARKVTLRRATGLADDIYGASEIWVQSEAVLKIDLGEGKSAAMLALGSEDPQRFNPEQGTDLLNFFNGALERMLRRWLT